MSFDDRLRQAADEEAQRRQQEHQAQQAQALLRQEELRAKEQAELAFQSTPAYRHLHAFLYGTEFQQALHTYWQTFAAIQEKTVFLILVHRERIPFQLLINIYPASVPGSRDYPYPTCTAYSILFLALHQPFSHKPSIINDNSSSFILRLCADDQGLIQVDRPVIESEMDRPTTFTWKPIGTHIDLLNGMAQQIVVRQQQLQQQRR